MNYSVPYTYPPPYSYPNIFPNGCQPPPYGPSPSPHYPGPYNYPSMPPPYPYPYPMVPPPHMHSLPPNHNNNRHQQHQNLHQTKRIKRKGDENDSSKDNKDSEEGIGSDVTAIPSSVAHSYPYYPYPYPYPHHYPFYHHLLVQNNNTSESDHEERDRDDDTKTTDTDSKSNKRAYPDEYSSDVDSSLSQISADESSSRLQRMKTPNMAHSRQNLDGRLPHQSTRIVSSYGPAADKLKKEGLKTVCDFCAKRKIKCIKPGDSLTCNFCSERGFPCTFTQHKKRGRPRVHYLILDSIKDELKKQKEEAEQQKQNELFEEQQ